MERPRLVIIDGYSLLFRAFYGTRFLSTSDGQATNALFGFTNMLISIFSTLKPNAIIVALDAPGKTFRHADFPEYKGTRRETPDELVSQLKLSRGLIEALAIPVFEITGYEADDIVGTVSAQAEDKGYITTIITGDHDALQLVDDMVSVQVPQNGGKEPKTYTPEKVVERYGFGPERVIDYKALAGDSSDNIPGVAGIGDKSAKALIEQFGPVESMLEQMDEVPEKFRKKVEPAIQNMLLSKRLATIDREVPVVYDFAPFKVTPESLDAARRKLLSFEFKNHVPRIEKALAPYMDGDAPVFEAVAQTSLEPAIIAKAETAAELQNWVGDGNYSLCLPESEDQKSMFDDEPSGWMVAKGNEVREASAEAVYGLFASAPDRAIGHDLKSLYKNIDPCLTPPHLDTMIAAYVLQSGRGTYEAGSIIQGYLDAELPLSPEQQTLGLLLLDEPLREKIKAEGEEKVLYDVELPLVPLLAEMEQAGIATSAEMLHEFSKSLEIDIEKTRQTVWEYAGQEFNIGSPKQIGQILFEKLEIPGGKKTKTGWATGVEILSDLQADWEIAGEILTYRELTKLKSTYADSLPKMIKEDGRIHTSFSQAVAATGRLSSSDPNLQNIPIRTELGRQIRRAFHAEEGKTLLSLDYSQIELRVLAHMCDDENLTEAFQSGTDVHTVTAALMFNIKPDEVTKEQRGMAKMLNYAVLYGVTGYGLSNQLGAEFNPASANELIEQYQERFPKIHGFMEEIVAGAKSTGFTTTLIGRRRHFPDIHAANWNTRQYAERQAMNAPIQGTAADMIKMAMLDVRKLIEGSELTMLLQVHDELVFEGTPDVIQEWTEPIREAMEQALPLDVPVEVDAKVGENWLEMKPI